MSLEAEFRLAGNNTYLRIDLDAILHNWNLLQNMCSQNTVMIAVLKANACGHGSVPVARHLYDHGVRHFAVATPLEGVLLRQAGLHGFIQIFGSNIEAADSIARFQLTPTVSSTRVLDAWAATNKAHEHQGNVMQRVPAVVLKVDSGMSRHGCQIQELEDLVKHCRNLGIPIHSVMTHFANAWGDQSFTKEQLDSFLKSVKSLRQEGMKIHVANCPAMFKGVGVDLDFVRPGICIYGMPPDMCDEAIKMTTDLGFRPALRWLARPTLIKELPAGRQIGYSLTYRLQRAETIATFNFGYADSYSRRLSNTGVLSTQSGGAVCPVVGRVSMDAVTAIVDKGTSLTTPFVVYADDFSSPNCVTNVCRVLDTIPQEVCALLPTRLPRVYVTQSSIFTAHN